MSAPSCTSHASVSTTSPCLIRVDSHVYHTAVDRMGRLMDCQFVVTNMGTLTLPTDHVRPMGDTAQERAQRAAGLTGRSPQCLVTGFLLIDHCTVVPRSTDVEIVKRLEWAWGMQLGQLYLDSRWNIILLSPSLYRSFDRAVGGIMLVPEEKHIKRLYDELTARCNSTRPPTPFKEVFTEPTYRYRLVGLDPQSPRFVSYLPDDSEEVVVSRFPFSDLAPIASHLKPHFAIYDCGHKLNNGIPTAAIEHGIVSRETIQNMLALYQAWISPLPFHNFPPGTYKNHRLRHIPQRAKRRYSGDHEGERSPVRIRKRLSDTDQEARSEHGDPVFAAGLAELNRQFDPHVHPNAIESWISDTVPTSDNDTSNGANIVPASYS